MNQDYVYITNYNANKIVNKRVKVHADLNKFRQDFDFRWYNKHEIGYILSFRLLFENPEEFFRKYMEIEKAEDDYTMVEPPKDPAYHPDFDCRAMREDYENFIIPEEITKRGQKAVEKFRVWFKTNRHLLERVDDLFQRRMELAFGISAKLARDSGANSGVAEIIGNSQRGIETKIENLISQCKIWYEADEFVQIVLDNFGSNSYFLLKDKNASRFFGKLKTDQFDRAFEVLGELEMKYKNPLKRLFIEYYKFKFNENLKFKKVWLEQIGFKHCRWCQMTEESGTDNTKENFKSLNGLKAVRKISISDVNCFRGMDIISSVKAYLNALIKLYNKGEIDNAIQSLEIAIALDHTVHYFYALKGYCHMIQENYKDARIAYEEMLKTGGDCRYSKLNYAICLYNCGAKRQSLRLFDQSYNESILFSLKGFEIELFTRYMLELYDKFRSEDCVQSYFKDVTRALEAKGIDTSFVGHVPPNRPIPKFSLNELEIIALQPLKRNEDCIAICEAYYSDSHQGCFEYRLRSKLNLTYDHPYKVGDIINCSELNLELTLVLPRGTLCSVSSGEMAGNLPWLKADLKK